MADALCTLSSLMWYNPGDSAVPGMWQARGGLSTATQGEEWQNRGVISIQRELRDHLVQPLHIAEELR